MRIPYAPSEPAPDASPETRAVYERIAARRAPRPLIPLDRALLHNPAIADGYNSLLGAIRTQSSFPLALAELAICYIAVLNDAVYEWTAHAPIALKAGATRAAVEAVLRGDVQDPHVLTDEERDVLRFTEQSTKKIHVDEELFARLKGRYTDQQVMELTITVAGYNMVSRFLVGLDVTESNGKEMKMPE
jgi:alkylhydroperoxidase family enzyme